MPDGVGEKESQDEEKNDVEENQWMLQAICVILDIEEDEETADARERPDNAEQFTHECLRQRDLWPILLAQPKDAI
ncbi:MAG: hypothetical protein V4465_03140 [Patescibacteria group bacterium]